MIFRRNFRKLLTVCLKMLFRKSTRRRFICLVVVFLVTMGFNTYSYIQKYHDSENAKKAVIHQKAFKVFFLRARTRYAHNQLIKNHEAAFNALGARLVKNAFIYQNNLFIHLDSEELAAKQIDKSLIKARDKEALWLLYDVFGIRGYVNDFFKKSNPGETRLKIRNNYVDYNGAALPKPTLTGRHSALKGDLLDIADLIRGNLWGKRLEIFNTIKDQIIDNIQRKAPKEKNPDPFLSRIELIVPMNILHLFWNLRSDNVTDIIDFANSVRPVNTGMLEVEDAYLAIPDIYRTKAQPMYRDFDIYPRYIPMYAPGLLAEQWQWPLYKDIRINDDFMGYIKKLHFSGQYLFSYEKSHIIKEKILSINNEIRTNHIHFYLLDLSMGIAFPFMISLFAFIHLKTEFAYMLMFRNWLRELVAIFWVLPLMVMLVMKSGLVAAFFWQYGWNDFLRDHSSVLVLPMVISFIVASIVFFPINRWSFSQLMGNTLNLYALHKGR